MGSVLKIMGTGDAYTCLSKFTYPGDPRPWHLATLIELRDGKVVKEPTIFGESFELRRGVPRGVGPAAGETRAQR